MKAGSGRRCIDVAGKTARRIQQQITLQQREKQFILGGILLCSQVNKTKILSKVFVMYTLNETEEMLCQEIVDCAYRVHSKLGPGLLEKIYEVCFCHELCKKGIPFKRQVKLPINYDGIQFDEGLQMDVLVDEQIICEFKAVEIINPVWQAQIISHLKLSELHVGFLINFNSVTIKRGLRRYCV